jgi:predicted dehydrogenase
MSRKQTAGLSRRHFMTTAASAAAATTILPRHVLGGPNFVAPSDKVNVAVIGVGGQGRTNCRALFQQDDCQIIAIADACEEWDLSPYYYRGKAGRGPVQAEIEKHYSGKTPNYKCPAYEDFRVMLEKEKAVDAVLIATPDHLHAYVSIVAMKAGRHVYCEKPLTRDIAEGRLVAQVARETGVATQMGNHGRSGEGHRQTAEWLWDGAIGPSEWRPYHPAYAPFNWRGWWAFGGGGLSDVAVHHLDPAFYALQLDVPDTVEATAPDVDEEVASTGVLATWRFGPRFEMGPVSVFWYDGGLRPPTPLGVDPDDPRQRMGQVREGITFIGEKGIMTCGGWSGMPRLLPRELHKEYERPEKVLPRVEGHHADWLQACKGGTPACSNFDYAARLCEFVLLGIVALRARKQIKWDPENMTATTAKVDRYNKGPYRAGWELPV